MMRYFLALLMTGLSSLPLQASDLEREQRMADEIVDAIFDGHPIDLNDGDNDFLGIYTEASEEPRGAVLILHGRGFHPDWADTVNPLRVNLSESNWNTLSIQMPVLEKTAKYFDYLPVFAEAIPRIDAALAYLRDQGNEQIVLIAHSCGAHMAMDYLREKGDAALMAFVGLGMGATDYRQPMQSPFVLNQLKVPVLDLYGANDYPAVHRLAPLRAQQMTQAGNPYSRQQVLHEADHYYTDRGEALSQTVSTWLNTLP